MNFARNPSARGLGEGESVILAIYCLASSGRDIRDSRESICDRDPSMIVDNMPLLAVVGVIIWGGPDAVGVGIKIWGVSG